MGTTHAGSHRSLMEMNKHGPAWPRSLAGGAQMRGLYSLIDTSPHEIEDLSQLEQFYVCSNLSTTLLNEARCLKYQICKLVNLFFNRFQLLERFIFLESQPKLKILIVK